MKHQNPAVLAALALCIPLAAAQDSPRNSAQNTGSPVTSPVMSPVTSPMTSQVTSSATAATPASRIAAKSTATSAESPEIRELQKVEDSWSTALNQRDQYGLELVLSPLFVNVSAAGDITTRNQQLASLITLEDKTATTAQRVITVRMLGDVAVANGTYDYNHKVNGKEMDEKGVFTHVFQREHGNWVCLNAQRTLVREDTPGKTKAPKGKSQAELPFHVPLFSKGDKSSQANP